MDKWEYIRLISKRGNHYGYNGGVFDLLEWCKKENTMSVTFEETKEFWEKWPLLLSKGVINSQQVNVTESL